MQTGRDGDSRLFGEDLTFWWLDSPLQPTTMAILLLLDGSPEPRRLRAVFERAAEAVPRLTQHVVEPPLGISLPHWRHDPTFDLDYHVRRHTLAGKADLEELYHEIGPAYETPFDRSRPLWEARVYDGLAPDGRSALFFKLHHCVADGLGGNAILAALTDGDRDADLREPMHPNAFRPSHNPAAIPRPWPTDPGILTRVIDELRERVELDAERTAAVLSLVGETVRHPERIPTAFQALRSMIQLALFDSHSPLKSQAGRARELSGLALPFEEVRTLKRHLDGCVIDVLLTVMAMAIGRWFDAHGIDTVDELLTLVPVNLRKPEEWGTRAQTGNAASGILLPLPIRAKEPLDAFREIRARMSERKADPVSTASPIVAEALSGLPRPLVTWLAESTFGNIDFIVTNVPGIMVPRYLAGTEIVAAYPFAPVALRSPVSVALYTYRDKLFIGLDSDRRVMPDVREFQAAIREAFHRLQLAAGIHPHKQARHPSAPRRRSASAIRQAR